MRQTDLVVYVQETMDHLKKNQFTELSNQMVDLPAHGLWSEDEVMKAVCLLRTTFPARSFIDNWTTLRDRLNTFFKQSGKEPSTTLRGLYH